MASPGPPTPADRARRPSTATTTARRRRGRTGTRDARACSGGLDHTGIVGWSGSIGIYGTKNTDARASTGARDAMVKNIGFPTRSLIGPERKPETVLASETME